MLAAIQLAYLLAALLFIFGIKMMSHPKTAVRGNLLGAAGMLVAILATLVDKSISGYWLIAVGLAASGVIGTVLAQRVQMTSMPQLVALLNGLGGAASVLVAWADLMHGTDHSTDTLIAIGASGIIGAVTLLGSLIAYAKLEEWKSFKKPFSLPGQQYINLGLLIASCLLIVIICRSHSPGLQVAAYLAIVVLSSILGVFLVNPIGGADMPVVISLMNSYSGIAAAATGFILDNNALIISGPWSERLESS